MKCEKCNAELLDNAKFCIECGTKVEKQTYCVNCGALLPQGAKFCVNCGENVSVIPNAQTSVKSEECINETKNDNETPRVYGIPLRSYLLSLSDLSDVLGLDNCSILKIHSVWLSSYKNAEVSKWNKDGILILWKRKRNDYKAEWLTLHLLCKRTNGETYSDKFEIGLYVNFFNKLSFFHNIEDYYRCEEYFYSESLQDDLEKKELQRFINSLDNNRLYRISRTRIERKLKEINGSLVSLYVKSGSKKYADAVIDSNGDVVIIANKEGFTVITIKCKYEELNKVDSDSDYIPTYDSRDFVLIRIGYSNGHLFISEKEATL